MKGLLMLLIAVVALGYGCALVSTRHGVVPVPCGPMFDLVQLPGARWARDDVGRPQGIVEGLRSQRRRLVPPCDP